MRQLFVEALQVKASRHDFSFVTKQRGMFSYSGLTKARVERPRNGFPIHAIDTGRICVAALKRNNVAKIAHVVAAVL